MAAIASCVTNWHIWTSSVVAVNMFSCVDVDTVLSTVTSEQCDQCVCVQGWVNVVRMTSEYCDQCVCVLGAGLGECIENDQ